MPQDFFQCIYICSKVIYMKVYIYVYMKSSYANEWDKCLLTLGYGFSGNEEND
jgi:hypothetical protein